MTSEPANKSGAQLDRQYEDDLRELFERLLKGTRAAEPEGETPSGASAEPEPEPEPEPEARAEPEQEPGLKAGVEPEAETKTEPEAQTEAAPKAEADAKVEDGVAPESETQAKTDAASGAGDPAAGRGAGSRARRLLIPALAVVAAVAIGASAFVAGRAAGAGEDAPRRQLAVRVGEIASTLYNYDYRSVDRYLNRQPTVMTKAMADQVGQSRETISAIITGGKLVWTSRVTRVYVADVNARTASAIVELDGKVTNTKGISTLTGTVVRFQLAKVRGVWLVAKAPETLTIGNESATDLNGRPIVAPSPSAQATQK